MEEALIIHYLEKYKNDISPEKKKYYEGKLTYTDLGAARIVYKFARKFFD